MPDRPAHLDRPCKCRRHGPPGRQRSVTQPCSWSAVDSLGSSRSAAPRRDRPTPNRPQGLRARSGQANAWRASLHFPRSCHRTLAHPAADCSPSLITRHQPLISLLRRLVPKDVPIALGQSPLINLPVLDLVSEARARKSAPGFCRPDPGKAHPAVIQGLPIACHGAAVTPLLGEGVELTFGGKESNALLPEPGLAF